MKDEHNLDKLFKEGLEEIDTPFREEDWMAMSEKLDQQERKTISPLWWSLIAGTAAAVMVFFLFFNTPKNNNSAQRTNKKQPKAIVPEIKGTITEKGNLAEEQIAQSRPNTEVYKSPTSLKSPSSHKKPITNGIEPTMRDLQVVDNQIALKNASGNLIELIDAKLNRTAFADVKFGRFKPTEKELQKMAAPQRLSFTFMAAPDISSTSSSINNKVSTDVGLMVNYALTKKIGVSTGVIYAKKLYDYNSRGQVVSGYTGTDWSVDANCKVLDLPINLDYKIFKKRNIAVNVSAGVSSYIMLNEKYQLTTGPALTVTNEEVTGNKHFLGVANFSVSVERKVSSRLSVGLQPFVKLPLTGIGKYEGNLSSAGVSVLFNIKSLSNN